MAVKARIRTACKQVTVAAMTKNMGGQTQTEGRHWKTARLCVSNLRCLLRVAGHRTRNKVNVSKLWFSEILFCVVGLQMAAFWRAIVLLYSRSPGF
jgi:hypothetical protein